MPSNDPLLQDKIVNVWAWLIYACLLPKNWLRGGRGKRFLPFLMCFSSFQTFHLDLAVLRICHATSWEEKYLSCNALHEFINSCLCYLFYRCDIWQMLASLAASKIQMLISFHNLASAAQICTQKILFWITIIFDINTKHTHSCPRSQFPPSMGFSSQTLDLTLLCTRFSRNVLLQPRF